MSNLDNHIPQDNNSSKRRVLFIITRSEFGGAQRFLLNFLGHFNKEKFTVLIAAGEENKKDNIFLPLRRMGFSTMVIPSLDRKINFKKDLLAFKELKKAMVDFKPDTIFLISSKAGFLGSLAAKKLGLKAKIIYRIGGWTFNDPWPIWKKIFFIILEKCSARWKDIIVLNNELDFKLAKRYGIKPRGSILVIPNGFDVYKMKLLPAQEAKSKLLEKIPSNDTDNILQAKTVVGTIANFYPAKGLKYLIEAAGYFRDDKEVVFIVIGDGIERPALELLIKQKNLQHKVFLPGNLIDACQYLSAFNLFVLPSVKEGFPWAVIEAMAAKLPVIVSNVGAIPEIIQSGKNGIIVPPGKPEIMADTIKMVLESSNLAQELGTQAHQRVLFKYGLDKMVSQIEGLL